MKERLFQQITSREKFEKFIQLIFAIVNKRDNNDSDNNNNDEDVASKKDKRDQKNQL